MKVVDRVQVHVFFVPTEERSPNANIEVGLSDTWYLARSHTLAITVKKNLNEIRTFEWVNLLENCLELAKVPRHTSIEKRIRLVCSIYGCLVSQRFPILRLNLNVRALKGLTIALFLLEVLEVLARLSNVFKLVVSILTINILFNGCYYTKFSELDQTSNVGKTQHTIYLCLKIVIRLLSWYPAIGCSDLF